MPTKRAPTRLAALLRLLEQHGVTAYEDGTIRLTMGRHVPRETVERDERPAAPGARPKVRPPARVRDAVDLAVNGISYDPEEGPEEPGN